MHVYTLYIYKYIFSYLRRRRHRNSHFVKMQIKIFMQMCEPRNTINYAKEGEEGERQERRREKNIIIITKPAKPNEAKRQAQKQLPVTWQANA